MFDEATVCRIVSCFPSSVFVIDEAYFEFSRVTHVDLLQTHQNIIVLRWWFSFNRQFSLHQVADGH